MLQPKYNLTKQGPSTVNEACTRYTVCIQTCLTAQVHKRARFPPRLKVILVSGIFRPSTCRLWFIIHTLWNVSYTCMASHRNMRTTTSRASCRAGGYRTIIAQLSQKTKQLTITLQFIYNLWFKKLKSVNFNIIQLCMPYH